MTMHDRNTRHGVECQQGGCQQGRYHLVLLLLCVVCTLAGCSDPATLVTVPSGQATVGAAMERTMPALATAAPATVAPATSAPPTPSPEASPTALPSDTPTVVPATLTPEALPTALALPSETPTLVPTSIPAANLLDVPLQSAALLPDFVSDLDRAADWDRYTIVATLDPDGLTIQGSQQVELRNRASEPFDALYFHLYPNHPDFGGGLRVENVRVDGEPVEVSTEQNNVLLRVALPQPLPPGGQAVVNLEFLARTQRNASNSAYGAFNQQSGVWSLATFYPVLALYRDSAVGGPWSGWDRRVVSSMGDLAVTETALYDVTLAGPADWTLVTTGVRVGDPELLPDSGLRRERFVSGPQRDFFLAAVRGLDQASTVVDGTRIVAYYQPGNSAAGQRALLAAEDSLRAFNQRYGRYPLTELEVVQAALTRFLGVEYPGVVLIEENLYQRSSRTLETTVAHEVAHQWWYSLVGNDYQGEPWLDEGLASYSQIIYYESLGDGGRAEAELQSFREQYQRARSAGRDGAVDRPVTAFRGNYVALVYAKSALFFQALREQLGDATFFSFLQSYYTSYRYSEVNGREMLATAEVSCGCDLQQFYADWISDAAPVDVP